MLKFVKNLENNPWGKAFSGERRREIRSIIEVMCVQKLIWLYYQSIVLEGMETCFVLDFGRHVKLIKLNSLHMKHRDKKKNTEDKGSLIWERIYSNVGAYIFQHGGRVKAF